MSRVTDLERENAILYERIAELEAIESTNLAELVPEAEGEIIELAENLIGRSVNVSEAYYLGKLLGAFKTPQIKRALISKRFARDPLRAAYAATVNGAFGKSVVKPESRYIEPKYKLVGLDHDPWSD